MHVFPAGAGMNLERQGGTRARRRVPRGCGDEPAEAEDARTLAECSPRVRG